MSENYLWLCFVFTTSVQAPSSRLRSLCRTRLLKKEMSCLLRAPERNQHYRRRHTSKHCRWIGQPALQRCGSRVRHDDDISRYFFRGRADASVNVACRYHAAGSHGQVAFKFFQSLLR